LFVRLRSANDEARSDRFTAHRCRNVTSGRAGAKQDLPPWHARQDARRPADQLIKALRDLGYTEGQNLTVEWRFAQGVAERWLPLARELVALKVDAIVVPTTPAALAARQATKTIPIVMPTAIDPVGARLAESLARPGGNVTGFTVMSPEISTKALSLLKEAVPALRRVAVLWNAANPAFTSLWQSVNAIAGSLDLTLLSDPVREPEDFPPAFAAIASQRPEAFFVLIDALLVLHLGEIIKFTGNERLPSASTFRGFAAAGGLMSYGPNLAALQRQAADYVDRVFKGESPANAAVPAADNVRVGHQSQDRGDARPHGAAIAAGPGRRCDRIIVPTGQFCFPNGEQGPVWGRGLNRSRGNWW
jgi:putative ABC transport system substrate-binding protein